MNNKVFFTSLGCSKNLIDSEVMMYLLESNNFEITLDDKEANIIIVNTCGFINSAKEESIQTILTLAENKKYGKCSALIVSGCLAERYHDELAKELPEVDAIIGTGDYKSIVSIVEDVMAGNKKILFGNQELFDIDYLPRKYTGSKNFAYLKIAEGCDNRCTYCIIPYLRGRLRSRKMESIIDEAKNLAGLGVKELIIIAQDTTKYGLDLYKKPCLVELLKELAKIEGIEWIRILYSYPDSFTKELIEYIAFEPKICSYLDIPIQHISDGVLKRMGRKTSKKQILSLIDQLREQIPDITLRTTLIVGFPGESEEDFQELLDFVRWAQFDKLGVFEYSQEENTPAYKLEPQVDDDIKTKRRNKIMEMQQHISYKKNLNTVGKIIDVLIEDYEHETYIGRSQRDAPEIDGLIYIKKPLTDKKLIIGSIYKIKITDALEYDLEGEVFNEHCK